MQPPPLPDQTDVLVVGAGIAGACVALALKGRRAVTVVDAGRPASGASGAAAGLVNPFMGRKAKPAWRHEEALDALDGFLDAAGTPSGTRRDGIVRPATSEVQALTFAERAAQHPGLGWLGPEAAAERWPLVASPHGALAVHRGGAVRIPAFVEAAIRASGADLHLGVSFQADEHGHVAITDQGETRYRTLVLALGDGAHRLPMLDALPLHRVKGQTVRLGAALPDGHPAVAGNGYVVPEAGGVVVGSTFEHTFSDTEADPSLDAGLTAAAARLVPCVAGAEVVERRAGVRLTVPVSVSPRRLPLAGPIPGHTDVYVLSGLGAKGLLMAPLLARHLADALDGRAAMPPEVDPASVLGG